MKNIILIAIFGLILSIDSIIEYHDNGMPKIIATYKGSNSLELTKKVGYYDNGEKHYEINYYKGKVKNSQVWDKGGNKITENMIEEITGNKKEVNYIDELLNMHEKQNEKIIYIQNKIDSLELQLSESILIFNNYNLKNDTIINNVKMEADIINNEYLKIKDGVRKIDSIMKNLASNINPLLKSNKDLLYDIRMELSNLETKYIKMLNLKGDSDPEVIQLAKKIKTLKSQLNIKTEKYVQRGFDEEISFTKEPFIDQKNGKYDSPEKFQDKNFNKQWDEGEYFVDTNKNGKYDSGDMLLDVNKNGIYDEDVDQYVDIVGNGIYDEGEKFTDLNNNGIYDDGSKSIQFEPKKRDRSKFIAFDEPPRPIKGKEIKFTYPPQAKSAGIEGTVTVEFYIDKKGNVIEVNIVKGADTILDKAAIAAVKKSKWEPARQRDKKVGVWVEQQLSFRLN